MASEGKPNRMANVIRKMQASVEDGKFYEAQQQCKTLYSRFCKVIQQHHFDYIIQ
jgi:hypothetical protein